MTPSAWNGYYRAFQIGDNGTALSTFQSSFTGNKTAHLTTNAYATYSGSGVVWNYITNNWASGRLTIHNNIFEFHQAAASTGVIGYTQAMTLDASGNLLVGTASANAQLTVVRNTDGVVASFSKNAGSGAFIYADATQCYYGASAGVENCLRINQGTNVLAFNSNGSERLRIKSTGQVNFVGLASDPAGAAAGDVYYNTTTNKLKCYNGTTWNDLF